MKLKPINIALLLSLAASLMITSGALAHALLIRSAPAANAALIESPDTLELWFSEPLETDFSSANLLTSAGDEILPKTVTIDPDDPTHLTAVLGTRLPPGNYMVIWKTLSRADGHDFYGNYPFTVLNPDGSRPAGSAPGSSAETGSETPTLPQVVSRWLSLIGGMLFLSAPLFMSFVLSGVLVPGSDVDLINRLNSVGLKICTVAVLGIVVGSWFQIASQAASITNHALLLQLIFGTHSAALALARQTLGVCGLLLAISVHRPWAHTRPILIVIGMVLASLMVLTLIAGFEGEEILAALTLLPAIAMLFLIWRAQHTQVQVKGWLWIILLANGILILLSFSFGSHAKAVQGSFWAVLFDFIHLLASAAWLGGLMLLPLMLDKITSRTESAPNFAPLRPLFRRYGYMAKFSFFLLLTTGLFNSLIHFPTFASLIGTMYGQILLIKIGLMIAVWWLSVQASRIFRQKPDPARMTENLHKFIRRVSQAALIGLGLMASIAVLVQTQPPPGQPYSASIADTAFHNMVRADDLLAHIYISPALPGDNQFQLQLLHEDGSSIGDVQLARLLFEYQEANLGQSSTILEQREKGIFTGAGSYMNQPGKWKLTLYVRRRGLDDVLTEIGMLNLAFPVSQPGAPFQNPVAGIPSGGLLAAALVISGVEIFRWRKTLQQVQPAATRYFLSLGGMLIIFGLVLGLYILAFYNR